VYVAVGYGLTAGVYRIVKSSLLTRRVNFFKEYRIIRNAKYLILE
jgi:hypothetical protein